MSDWSYGWEGPEMPLALSVSLLDTSFKGITGQLQTRKWRRFTQPCWQNDTRRVSPLSSDTPWHLCPHSVLGGQKKWLVGLQGRTRPLPQHSGICLLGVPALRAACYNGFRRRPPFPGETGTRAALPLLTGMDLFLVPGAVLRISVDAPLSHPTPDLHLKALTVISVPDPSLPLGCCCAAAS